MARSTAEIQAEIALTRDAIAQRLDTLQRRAPRDWALAAALLGAGLLAGVLLARVPVIRWVGTGVRLLWAGANVTAALAVAHRLLVSRRPVPAPGDVQPPAQVRNRLRRVS